MRSEDVPQDESFYDGHLRACYALDRDGRYVVATSRGWEVERIATAEALGEMAERLESVRRAVLAGRMSPLAYHMTVRQMTPRLLARSAGLRAWRVRRHLRPKVFDRLGERLLRRYAGCLDLTIDALMRVPGAGAVDPRGGTRAS